MPAGGFNQPIMCGGEPRVMTKKERGSLCDLIYAIKINVPVHGKPGLKNSPFHFHINICHLNKCLLLEDEASEIWKYKQESDELIRQSRLLNCLIVPSYEDCAILVLRSLIIMIRGYEREDSNSLYPIHHTKKSLRFIISTLLTCHMACSIDIGVLFHWWNELGWSLQVDHGNTWEAERIAAELLWRGIFIWWHCGLAGISNYYYWDSLVESTWILWQNIYGLAKWNIRFIT